MGMRHHGHARCHLSDVMVPGVLDSDSWHPQVDESMIWCVGKGQRKTSSLGLVEVGFVHCNI